MHTLGGFSKMRELNESQDYLDVSEVGSLTHIVINKFPMDLTSKYKKTSNCFLKENVGDYLHGSGWEDH